MVDVVSVFVMKDHDHVNYNHFLMHAHSLIMLAIGPNSNTMKVHLLRHIISHHIRSGVRDWGPLWAYSAFQFEGMNYNIKK